MMEILLTDNKCRNYNNDCAKYATGTDGDVIGGTSKVWYLQSIARAAQCTGISTKANEI